MEERRNEETMRTEGTIHARNEGRPKGKIS